MKKAPVDPCWIHRGLFSLKKIATVDEDMAGGIDPVFLDVGFLHRDPPRLKHIGHLRTVAVEDTVYLFFWIYMREHLDMGVIAQGRMMAVAAFHDADRRSTDLTLSVVIHDMTVKSTVGKYL